MLLMIELKHDTTPCSLCQQISTDSTQQEVHAGEKPGIQAFVSSLSCRESHHDLHLHLNQMTAVARMHRPVRLVTSLRDDFSLCFALKWPVSDLLKISQHAHPIVMFKKKEKKVATNGLQG